MCGQWGEKGIASISEAKDFIALDKLVRLLDEAAPHHPEIYLWGGEPTLHPNFQEFIHEIKKRKLTCTINTNGLLLERHCQAILENHVDSIDVSLLGTEQVHDFIVRAPGSYKQVMRGLSALSRGKQRPLINAIVTLSNNNLENAESLLSEIETNPAIDLTILQLGWFVPCAAGKGYEDRMRDEFSIRAESWRGFQNDDPAEKAPDTKDFLERVTNNRRYKKPILLFPDIKLTQVTPYFANHADLLGHSKCWTLYRGLDIRPNGDVVICADFPDYILGNIHEESIQRIWSGGKAKAFRESIAKNGLLPICSRCCGLFR